MNLYPALAITISALAVTSLDAASPADYSAPESGKVRIVRDTYGVPHIIARDNRSLFFGAGYAQAEDQLENLSLNYLRGKGRAAEREGQSQLQIDLLVRALDIPELAKAVYLKSDPETKEQLEGFAAGANRFINKNRQQIPEWIEQVEPYDVISFAMYIDAMFALGHCNKDLGAAGIKLSQNVPQSNLGAQFGSNQFAVCVRERCVCWFRR